jgi:hypothetical protein
MVKIYQYEVYDIETDRYHLKPTKGTQVAIESIGGRMKVESCEEVDASLLDGNGFIKIPNQIKE